MLALLLARKGLRVALLEAQDDFEREFRGDTIHPSVMEIMDQLGLAERLLELPHATVRRITARAGGERVAAADFSRLPTKFPYITVLPQARFLEFLTAEAAKHAGFQLVMRANVRELIVEEGAVRGVRHRGGEFHARLTVGADGRSSRVRRLAGFEAVSTSPPMDVLWFRLPRSPSDPEDTGIFSLGAGHLLVSFDRRDYWQAGYVIVKGAFREVRAAGLEAFRASVAALAPEFADRVDSIRDWKQVSLLNVESARCRTWHRPGLLLIGDAAHPMSPVGGVGINYAIQDAVVAANVLSEGGEPARVQRLRERPTKIVQAFQTFVQKRIVAQALRAEKPALPIFFRLPFLRRFLARFIAFGVGRVRVNLKS
jgi:2-polyprenyl-6-methoxyphenol hydroxylase-like FAD-dependent oxidoreductase